MTERASIVATYDSREVGLQYTVATRVGGRPLSVTPMPDPFMTHRVMVGWRDLLRGLLRRRLEVVVTVDAPRERVEDVMELDANYAGAHNSSRRREWNERIQRNLASLANGERG